MAGAQPLWGTGDVSSVPHRRRTARSEVSYYTSACTRNAHQLFEMVCTLGIIGGLCGSRGSVSVPLSTFFKGTL